MAQQWTCPHCNRPCSVGFDDVRNIDGKEYISEEYGTYVATTRVIVCPDTGCRQQTISLTISEGNKYNSNKGKTLFQWNLLPESEVKPFPEYIPAPIRSDYEEACLIKSKSPKASATLSRRCLQGIIRDYWGIIRNRLVDEITALEEKIDKNTWEAIDSVRHVGNIGAHMEKDVNLIIDVEPEEAGLLIWLIETLLTDWYIQRHERQQRMSSLVRMADKKKKEKTQPESPAGS